MRKIIALVNVSLLALAVGASVAAAAPPTRSASKTSTAAPKAAKASTPATHTVSGTLESFDPSAKTLTVKSAKSSWTFSAADARAWEGSKSIGVDDLSSHAGAKVTVKYTEHDGQKSASSVRLSEAHMTKATSKSK